MNTPFYVSIIGGGEGLARTRDLGRFSDGKRDFKVNLVCKQDFRGRNWRYGILGEKPETVTELGANMSRDVGWRCPLPPLAYYEN